MTLGDVDLGITAARLFRKTPRRTTFIA